MKRSRAMMKSRAKSMLKSRPELQWAPSTTAVSEDANECFQMSVDCTLLVCYPNIAFQTSNLKNHKRNDHRIKNNIWLAI